MLARAASRHGTRPDYDLLQVAYDWSPPPATTYPERWAWHPVPGLYLRVAAHDAGLTEVLIQVHYRRRRVWELTNAFHDPSRPYHFPTNRTVVLSDWIKLPSLTSHGFGLYATTIYFRAVASEEDKDEEPEESPKPRPWDPGEALQSRIGDGWTFGAVDYFRMVKP